MGLSLHDDSQLVVIAGERLRSGTVVDHPFVQRLSPPGTPLMLEEQVPDDGEEISAHRRELDAVPRRPRAHERFGYQVIGRRGVARQVDGEAAKVVCVCAVEPRELRVLFRRLVPDGCHPIRPPV